MLVHTMAEDTVELLGQLGVTSAVFVGWSDGGNFSPAGADPKAVVMIKGLKVGDFPPTCATGTPGTRPTAPTTWRASWIATGRSDQAPRHRRGEVAFCESGPMVKAREASR